jgi:hypothetical protein
MAKKRPPLQVMGLGQHLVQKGEPVAPTPVRKARTMTPKKAKKAKKATAAPKRSKGKGKAKTQARRVADSGIKRHVQVRLTDESWYALNTLAHDERRKLQPLMIEALNDLMRKYHKAAVIEGPPIASFE